MFVCRTKIKQYLLPVVASVLALLFLTACDSGSVNSHPLYIKAQSKLKAKDLDSAIILFEDLLKIRPDAFNVHLLLAKAYSEQDKDHLKAIYHFQVYIENTPECVERIAVEKLARLQRDKFAVKISGSIKQPKPRRSGFSGNERILRAALKGYYFKLKKSSSLVAALTSENSELKAQQSQLEQAFIANQNRYETNRKKLGKVYKELVKLKQQHKLLKKKYDLTIKSADSEQAAAAENSPATGKADGASGAAPKSSYLFHTLKKGDSLVKLAELYYGDKSKVEFIIEANSLVIKKLDHIKEGKILIIPPLDEDKNDLKENADAD